MVNIIKNGRNTPINVATGTLPNVGGALLSWFQPMTFCLITKSVVGFRAVEDGRYINFKGVIQPLEGRKLYLKPEGQRAWTWLWLHCTPNLILKVDDIITYRGKDTRVMGKKDYSVYGYVEYELVQDFTGSKPEPIP